MLCATRLNMREKFTFQNLILSVRWLSLHRANKISTIYYIVDFIRLDRHGCKCKLIWCAEAVILVQFSTASVISSSDAYIHVLPPESHRCAEHSPPSVP